MKSERRHELATNELAEWIANFPQWFQENKTGIIVGAVVVAGLIAYTIFFYSRQGKVSDQRQMMTTALLDQLGWQKETVLQGKLQGLGVSDTFLNTAGSLQAAADETENPLLSALAMIKRAEVLRAELHYRPKVAEPDARKYQLDQAKKVYEQALEKAKDSPEIAAMAEYGIALSLEDMGDFEGAQKLYEKIADSAEYQGSLFRTRAKLRVQALSDYKKTVFFAQVQKPETGQSIERQISGPLQLESPSTETGIISQKDIDFNLAK